MYRATVKAIKTSLSSTNKDGVMDKPWNEGYVTGLFDYDVISEDQFNELIEWILTG